MNIITSASNAATASSAPPSIQPSIASLQSQLQFYSQYESGTGAAAEAYKALQFAIQTHNISDAQNALARLKRDSESAGTTPAAAGSLNAAAGGNGGSIENSIGATGLSTNSIDATA
ncbi:MAG TPA: hypothetical protein VGY98_19010 [Verrucomicrobiae bacterium]|nr:hypothetical protein [Verrucomicrobiae bacterium]